MEVFRSPRRGQNWRRQMFWLRTWAISGLLLCAALSNSGAAADPLETGVRAFAAGNYVKAAEIFAILAPQGDPTAQTYLGYMFANGKGVPQDFIVAAGWYRCASQQGVARAQYQLGLMYDKAQGVPQDYMRAYALVNLAVAKAGPEREPWARIRDAIASKLSLSGANPGATDVVRGSSGSSVFAHCLEREGCAVSFPFSEHYPLTARTAPA